MFSPVSARATSAYRQVGVQSMVDGASPHQLIKMLFDGLISTLHGARGAIERGDIGEKVRHIGKAVRILQEGLLGAVDRERGGEVANNLAMLYEYCVGRLTLANARNDVKLVEEVADLVGTVSQGWTEMGLQGSATAGG
ncbi:flagellar export chaperone FliS [Comamonas endophytica]|uniref:Flagellar secretion chaperone FliS n=1 Tax=Comamonas endophytica TaxID=2949090 RepID=A0ABY6GEG9_9BURK|nr:MULTISPECIES: flagellar export chaperone FliS [unclassified Acidovorax]MCD2512742.1 flagellar export chaperone FliS [Acidovorax sp. D4N7]UYG52907.1 flagellar export chaperone FliS [Acidovorax sp. 5MLIR]